MATSSTTMLEVANQVLLSIGERTISAFGTPVGLKVRFAIQSAIRDLQNFHDFSWTKSRILATSWSGNRATLDRTVRVFNVRASGSSSGTFSPLINVPWDDFDGMFSSSSAEGIPEYWAWDGESTVVVYPTPTEDVQDLVYFYVSQVMTQPILPSDVLPIPERHLNLVLDRATYYMALTHLDDKTLAKLYEDAWRKEVIQVKNRETSTQVGELNMYRRAV